MSTNFIECKELTLQSAIGTSDTTIVVTGAYRYDGTIITEDDFGGAGEIVYATIEPKTDRQESLACTWVSNVAGVLTMSVTRALSGVAPYSTGGVAYSHSAGSAFIFTDSAALFNKLTAKDNDEVVTGAWEFPTPTTNPNPATKEYVDTELSDLDATLVHVTGAESIAGVKTFSDAPKIPDSGDVDEAVTRGELDAEEVKLTGNQTIAGTKTFSSSPVVPDATSAQHPITKAQYDAGAVAYLTNASPTQQGATKIDTVADTPSDPVALTATADRVNFMDTITGMIFLYGSASAPTGFLLCNGQAVSRTTYADLFAVTSTTYGVGDGSTTFNVPDLRSSFPIGYGQKTKTFTFTDGNVATGTDIITVPSNKFLYTGQAVALTTSGTLPTGLSATTYYVIYVSDTTIKLATSRANADDGTAVDITAASGGGTHTLTLTFTSRAIGDAGGEESHTLQTEELASHTHTQYMTPGPAGTGSGNAWNSNYGNTGATGSDTPHNTLPPFVTVNYIIKT